MTACRHRKYHYSAWRVVTRRANYSAFNGYHWTPSEYSAIVCNVCGCHWRSKAAYVDTLPDKK